MGLLETKTMCINEYYFYYFIVSWLLRWWRGGVPSEGARSRVRWKRIFFNFFLGRTRSRNLRQPVL